MPASTTKPDYDKMSSCLTGRLSFRITSSTGASSAMVASMQPVAGSNRSSDRPFLGVCLVALLPGSGFVSITQGHPDGGVFQPLKIGQCAAYSHKDRTARVVSGSTKSTTCLRSAVIGIDPTRASYLPASRPPMMPSLTVVITSSSTPRRQPISSPMAGSKPTPSFWSFTKLNDG